MLPRKQQQNAVKNWRNNNETWYLTHAEPTVAARAAKKKTYLDEIPEFIKEDFKVGLTAICDQLLPFQAFV